MKCKHCLESIYGDVSRDISKGPDRPRTWRNARGSAYCSLDAWTKHDPQDVNVILGELLAMEEDLKR